MILDPIGDLIIRIKNAQAVGKETIYVPHSKLKEEVVKVLVEKQSVEGYKTLPSEKSIKVLEIHLRPGAIEEVARVSKPGRRIYTAKSKIPTVRSGRGFVVLSTSKGVMSGDDARREGLGGELLIKVW